MYGRTQKQWQSELASILAVSGCIVGLLPRDRLLRDGRGDNFPTDDLAVLMAKRAEMRTCLENLVEFKKRVEREQQIVRIQWVEVYGEDIKVSQRYIEYIRFLAVLTEYVGIERMRISASLEFIKALRGVEIGIELCGGQYPRAGDGFMYHMRIMRHSQRGWRTARGARGAPAYDENQLWGSVGGGRGLDGVAPRDIESTCRRYEAYHRDRGYPMNGWSHHKWDSKARQLTCVKRIVDMAGAEHGLYAANLYCELPGVLMQSRDQSKRVQRVAVVSAKEGVRLMYPRGLNWRRDAYGEHELLAGRSKYGHPETTNTWWCWWIECKFYSTHIHGCSYSCPGVDRQGRSCGRRRPYPTMPPHKLWAKKRVLRMMRERIRLEDDKRDLKNGRSLYTRDQVTAISLVVEICMKRDPRALARWCSTLADARSRRKTLRACLASFHGEHEHFFGRAIYRLDEAMAFLR